ncbi:urea transporter [Arenibacterium sp. CAU 1754]
MLWDVFAEAYLAPVAAICLVNSPWVGLGLWLALFQQPQLALVGVLALTAIAALSLPLAKSSDGPGIDVTIRANALLSALAGAWVFLPADQSLLLRTLMILGTVLGGLLFTFLAKDLLAKSRLPPIVWPYCLIAFIMFTIFPDAPARSVAYFEWPLFQTDSVFDLLAVFLRSLGVFVFSPWPVSGLLIAGALLAWSPAMFLAGATGWLSGAVVSSLLIATGAPFYWAASSYNFFLSGMALGAVFFLPDMRGILFAAIGGAFAALIAALLQVLFNHSGVSYLPIPFAVTLFTGLVLLSGPPFGAPDDPIEAWSDKPERNRISRDWLRARWGRTGTPLVGIPLTGVLEITQGFDDSLSHKGKWRHALDFQRPLPHGETEDRRPSLWGETVFSPVSGRVAGLTQSIPDNQQGVVNYADNWGNHIILETSPDTYVILAHLMQNSMRVTPGQSVDFSTELGLVGNSGRSIIPHLHLSALYDARPGAPTRDFRLANYFVCAPDTLTPVEWHSSGHGKRGALVMAAAANPNVRGILSGILPGRGIWTVTSGANSFPPTKTNGPLVVETELLENGNYSISQNGTDWMTAALEYDGLRLNALSASSGSLVSLLAMCLSTVPYAAFPGLIWNDWLPRTFRTPAQRYIGQLNPLRRSTLNHVVMRCDTVQDQPAPALTVMATPKSSAGGVPMSCEVTIEAQKGPVRIVAHYDEGTVIYQQISFEPREF